MIVKIKFIAVHVDNYQGGSGKVYEHCEYYEINEETKIKDILNIDVVKSEKYYNTENIKILSTEIINVKKK